MIPDGCEARRKETYYDNGCIVMEFNVLVPDRTISGDFRYEHVSVRLPVENAPE